MYPVALVTPMAEDLTNHGFESLSTPTDVEKVLDDREGTTLLVVNSVCGCGSC